MQKDKHFILLLSFITFCLPIVSLGQGELYPPEGLIVSCKQLRFAWQSDGNESAFQIQISEDDGEEEFGEIRLNRFLSMPAAIVRNTIEFSTDYKWRVRPIISEGDTLDWSDTHHFSTIILPDSVRNAFQTETHIRDQYQLGFTITANYGTLLGIDRDGEIYWYIPGEPTWWVGSFDVRQLPSGEFLSILNRGARLFTPNDETIWNSRDIRNIGFHHEIFPMPSGTFLGLVSDAHWRVEDGDSTEWGVSNIIEINRNGNVVWRWNFWDHVSREDYDSLLFTQVPPNGHFDWTHCNACPFQESDSTIFLSVRNLNRIIKIAYPSGDIIWSMGIPMQSGIVDFGENLQFYRQHATEPLANGNLLFFDNHWSLDGDNDFSRAFELDIDLERDDPAQIVWEYRHEFSMTQGDADRLPNGNTLITTGQTGTFYEVNSEEELVWQASHEFYAGSYRGERIADFYPQVFCIVGPPDGSLVARWRGEVSYTVYNIGSEDGEYVCQLSDSEGWFRNITLSTEIAVGDSTVLTFYGHIPEDENLIDTLIFNVHIEQNSFDVQQWISTISPDPATSVGGGNNSNSEFKLSIYGGLSASRHLMFSLPKSNYVKITIFDLMGRRVQNVLDSWKEKGKHEMALAFNGLSAGSYLLRFSTQERVITKSLIILD